MHSTKYIILQEQNGWRGYLEGYPEFEAHGNSFEELQFKLWQLHQELTAREQEQDQYQQSEYNQHHSHTPTMSRPMSRAQIKRRARVEQLLSTIISNH